MAERIPIYRGSVDWAGENPGMFLRETADGPFVTLMVFFRIVISRFGRGTVLVLVEDSDQTTASENVCNLVLSDNDPLARYLVDEFCTQFGAFRGIPALRGLRYLPLTEVATSGDGLASYKETLKSNDMTVELNWDNLGDPFAVELPTDRSATGRHEMFSMFVEAHDASIVVNGRRLNGRAFPRDFQGRQTSSAFLAFCEAWLLPEG